MGRGGATGGADQGLGRTVLVVGADAELAVALRDRLPRAYVTVVEASAAEAVVAVRAGALRPWLVVGSSSTLPGEVVRLLARRPTLLLWRGEPPPGLPGHTRRIDLFSQLAGAVETAVAAEVGGVRLAPGDGLTMPDGSHAASPVLEALVANHPRPVFAAARHLRAASSVLDAHRVPLRVARAAAGGAVLVAEAA